MSRVVAAVVATFLASVLALGAAPARAATEVEQAEALIRQGVKLRASDSAALALPLFEQAYQVSRSPRTAAQLGLCELELGYWVAADRYLTEALAAPDHPWVARNKGTLKKSLEAARASIGELALVLSPANAEVLLNHKPLDRALLGAPLRLDKGLVDLEVRAPGYEAARETVIVSGGKREERTYTLVRAAGVAQTSATVPTLAGGGSSSPDANGAVTLTAAAPAPQQPPPRRLDHRRRGRGRDAGRDGRGDQRGGSARRLQRPHQHGGRHDLPRLRNLHPLDAVQDAEGRLRPRGHALDRQLCRGGRARGRVVGAVRALARRSRPRGRA
jgi:hypothetical protein